MPKMETAPRVGVRSVVLGLSLSVFSVKEQIGDESSYYGEQWVRQVGWTGVRQHSWCCDAEYLACALATSWGDTIAAHLGVACREASLDAFDVRADVGDTVALLVFDHADWNCCLGAGDVRANIGFTLRVTLAFSDGEAVFFYHPPFVVV